MTDKTPENSKQDRHTAKLTPIAGGKEGGDSRGDHMERLATTFESSARRWEMIVYPSLFAFIVLASYGFYLVYSLTHDVASLARNVSVLTQSIDRMVINMDSISGNMTTISSNMGEMNTKMDELAPIRHNMEAMNESTRSMAMSADGMRYQMGAMNYNIGRPMSQMSSFMPW
jgi:methyl-accepting chemotaxis protein